MTIPKRVQVAIVGAGPAGSLLATMLHREGIDCVIVERRSRAYVLSRIRAGVLEQGSVDVLREHGLAQRMQRQGFTHEGVNLAFGDRLQRIDFRALVGKSVTIYGQTELQQDLYDALDHAGCTLIDEADAIELGAAESERPFVIVEKEGIRHQIDCDIIAGCDGAHGVARKTLMEGPSESFECVYPFGWLGVLSRTPPVSDELIYAHHDRGFALCSMRNEGLSRYYVQCPLDDVVDAWPDERFWTELKARLPNEAAQGLVTGPSIEKSITPLRSLVVQPMQRGRLFLAGDSAHIVPPTGAKGLNLAISDVVYLYEAILRHYQNASQSGLDAYSTRALARVWKAVRFSWWMTTLLHRMDETTTANQGSFSRQLQRAELDYLFSSQAAQRVLAENYVGLPL